MTADNPTATTATPGVKTLITIEDLDRIQPLDLDRLTLDEIYRTLRPEIEARDDGHEYWSISTPLQYDATRRSQPIGKHRWIAVYAVTGGNEGHYVHVDRIYLGKEYDTQWTHEQLFLLKTFGGFATAARLAGYLGARLGA